jgi:NADH-quinone oxidoreductase subunit F
VWLDEYQSKNGYAGARRALTGMAPDEIVNAVKDSGLKGRGGAGFYGSEVEPDAERRIHEHPLPAV